MAGYTLQGKTQSGAMVDIPLAATYDVNGNSIAEFYASKTEYNTIISQLTGMEEKLDTILAAPMIAPLEQASWSTINAASKQGFASLLWKVGDEKKITLSTGEEVTLVILGFNHDDLSDGSGKAGITFGLKNALSTNYPMNSSNTNAGGWSSSVMRQTTLNTIIGYLPSDLRAVIKAVNKLTSAGSMSSTINTTSDKLFLFSLEEIMGTHMYSTTTQRSFSGEGEQYEYYKNAPIPAPTTGAGTFTAMSGDSGTFYTTDTSAATDYINKLGQSKTTTVNAYYNYNNAKAQGDDGTSSVFWWLRSPYYNSSGSFCYIYSFGIASTVYASVSNGVAFGFCV